MRPRQLAVAVVAAASLALVAPSALGAGDMITTIAGTGAGQFSGDGGLATSAALNQPAGVAVAADGSVLVADTNNDRVRRIAPDGSVTTIAGTTSGGYNGDNIVATSAQLHAPTGVAGTPDGGVLIADQGNHRIRRVSPAGVISTVAGTGAGRFGGDGGPATAAQLRAPASVATLPGGTFLVADTGNDRIRKVTADGTISTVAGTGASGFSGDGGPATSAALRGPEDVAPTGEGSAFLIADTGSQRIRRVAPDGTITTVAGNGVNNRNGDGGAATAANLSFPTGVTPTGGGGFLIADQGNDRVRRVTPDGVITTVAGTGSTGFGGDGGPAAAALLNHPADLAVDSADTFVVADQRNHRVRRVDAPYLTGAVDPANGNGITPTGADGDKAAGKPSGRDPEDLSGVGADGDGSPAPKLGKTVRVAPAAGTVLVKRSGSKSFVALEAGANVPVGSLLDTRKGSVALRSALAADGTSQTATFRGGIFEVRQDKAGKGMTDLVMRGGDFGRCRAAKKVRAQAARAKTPPKVRNLWAKDNHGKFRVHGANSAATARGTAWYTEDRCDGTLTKVAAGAVSVYDQRTHRRTLVKAGHQLLVRTARKR